MQPQRDYYYDNQVSDKGRKYPVTDLKLKHGPPVRTKNKDKDSVKYYEQSGRGVATVYESNSGGEPVHDGPGSADNNEGEEKKEEEKIVATRIISAAVNNRTTNMVELEEPIIYTLEHRTVSHLVSLIDSM